MNKKNKQSLIFILIVGFITLACGLPGSNPATPAPLDISTIVAETAQALAQTQDGTPPTQPPPPSGDGPASINLDDPNLYNQPSNVQTYRTSLEYTFSAVDGSAVNGAAYVDGETDVDANASNLVFQMEGSATLDGNQSFVATYIGGTTYMFAPGMGCMSGATDTMDNPFDTFLDTGGDLTGEAYRVQPDENVNGVDVYVYEITMDNMEGAATTEINELKEGRIYIAKDGFYVVRMRFVSVGTNEFLSGGSTIVGDEIYELNYYDFNQPIGEIVPPEGCTDMLSGTTEADYPLPGDASILSDMAGMVIFNTNLTQEELTAFYQTEMAVLGCSAGDELGNAQGVMIMFDGCPSGTVQIVIAPDPATGVQQVSIMSMP